MTRRATSTAVVVVLVFLAGRSFAELPPTYMYHREGHGAAVSATVELETAVGTREARPFGEEGYEQVLRARTSPLDWLTLEVAGGLLVTAEGETRGGLVAEANFAVLRQEAHAVDLTLGGGYRLDYAHVSVPMARLVVSRTFGAFDLALSGLLELPVAEGRDAADLVVGLAGSYRALRWLRVGAELLGEDLEGFWEDEEAEGGAKLVAGPTLWFDLGAGLALRANAGAVVAMTRSTPGDPQAGRSAESGFLGRLALGWTF